MKKWGNRFIIWSIILIVGPFFGITLKGFTEIDYTGHIYGALFFLIIGLIMKSISTQKNEVYDKENSFINEMTEINNKNNELNKEYKKIEELDNMNFDINYKRIN